ncbi:MAG: TIR domain-containing protein, partial [Pseudomonadota bacterium]
MAKLFLSYSRDDLNLIEKLAKALERAGHDVWWDRHIAGGAIYEKDIETALDGADVVIVAWSPTAVQSSWVKDEAAHGRDRGKLVPISLKGADTPLGFRQYQTIEFGKWQGDESAAPFHNLLSALALKTDGDAPAPLRASTRSAPSRAMIAAGVAIVAALIAAAAFFANRGGAPAPEAAAPQEERNEVAIAVLPFADLSPEGNQEYFADGLSEELLNVLVRIKGLKVASRTSAFAMKDQPLSIGEIADKLKVRHVVE